MDPNPWKKNDLILLEIGLDALDCLRSVCVLICNFFSVYLGIFFDIFGQMLNIQKIRNILKEKNILCTFKKKFM